MIFILCFHFFFLFVCLFLFFFFLGLVSLLWAHFCLFFHQYLQLYQRIIYIQRESTMKKFRTIIFSIVIQVVIALLIIDFRINPQHLRTKCVTAHSSSQQLGSGQIIDCISCSTISSEYGRDPFIGYASILVPLKDRSFGLNLGTNFDSTEMKSEGLHSQLLFSGDIYFQTGCSNYDCQVFHKLDDFGLRQKNNVEKLNIYNIDRNDAKFTVSNYSIPSLFYQLGLLYEQDMIVLETEYLNEKQPSSSIVRIRYNINDKIVGDQEPAILLYRLKTDIFVRLMLILVVLLEASQLYAILSHYTSTVKKLLFGILMLGFVSPTTAILSSTLAIYLTISKINNGGNYGIIVALLFALCSLSSISGRLPLSAPTLVIFAYCVFVAGKHLKERFSIIDLGTLIGVIIPIICMWQVGWSFYLFLTPLLMLAGLLSTKEEKEPHKSPIYDLVSFNDEEEDVLSKIERQLR